LADESILELSQKVLTNLRIPNKYLPIWDDVSAMIKALRDSHEAVTHLLVSEKKIQRNETQLRTMVEWCADSGIFTIADVVMNHLAAMDDCCDTATSLPFHDEHAVTGNLNVFKNPCFDSCATHMCVFEAVCQRTAGWCGRLQSPLTQCLDRPELLYCVKGSRPHPNQLSGSDLHGHQPTPDPPGDPSDSGFQLRRRPPAAIAAVSRSRPAAAFY